MPETEIQDVPAEASLRGLLAHYDRRVQHALSQVSETRTGTDRVRALHVLRWIVTAHDSVVASTLCPLLRELPSGAVVAERLRQGCEQRASLLGRFQSLSQGTDAHNVYPMFGPEIETILGELEESFDRHVDDETTRVGELLESAAASVSPEVIATRMAIEAGRAPVRAHRMTYRHPRAKMLRALFRGVDRVHDWNDSHHGWPSPRRQASQPVRPRRRYTPRPPSIPDLLSGYDETVESAIAELAEAEPEGPRWAAGAYRLGAAVAIHDSIVGGTLCQLLDAMPEGQAVAARLREGCHERAELLEEWNDLVRHASSPSDLFETRSADASRTIDELVASFRAHETDETRDVAAVIEQLRERHWRYGGTGLVSPYLLPVWPNPEPGVLAAHMALWADRAPTHPHRLLAGHPTNRWLRNAYRHADQLRDRRRARHGWPTLS